MKALKNVHYFPGHMAKALSGLKGYLQASDLVIEVADARAPFSSRNPVLQELRGQKPELLLLSKADLADPETTAAWIAALTDAGTSVLASDIRREKMRAKIDALGESLVVAKRAKEKRIGMKKQPLRLAVIGIPNVGKSTLINNLLGRTEVAAANRPGVTRSEQWVKLGAAFLLLDTPGLLPMDYPDGAMAVRLALLGAIKEEVLPNEELAYALLGYLREEYPRSLENRYGVSDLRTDASDDVFAAIARKRGFLRPGGVPDLDAAVLAFLRDFRGGELGRLSLEKPH